MRKLEKHIYNILVGKLKGEVHVEDVGVNVNMIFKYECL